MKLDINDATEDVGSDVIMRERKGKIAKMVQVSLREVHNNASFLGQRDHWTSTSVPKLHTNSSSTTYGGGGRRRRFIVVGGVEINQTRHGEN